MTEPAVVLLGGCVKVTADAGPASAVTAKATGEPAAPPKVAAALCGPAIGPRVQPTEERP
jgi:hypothetical protein